MPSHRCYCRHSASIFIVQQHETHKEHSFDLHEEKNRMRVSFMFKWITDVLLMRLANISKLITDTRATLRLKWFWASSASSVHHAQAWRIWRDGDFDINFHFWTNLQNCTLQCALQIVRKWKKIVIIYLLEYSHLQMTAFWLRFEFSSSMWRSTSESIAF